MIAYVPSNLAWAPAARPLWSSGGFSTDRATVLWGGPAPLKEAFLLSLEKLQWTPLPGFRQNTDGWAPYPYMWLEDWNESRRDMNFHEVELKYIGLKTRTLPDPKYTDGSSLKTATFTGVASPFFDGLVTGTVQYRASRTNWSWFVTSLPASLPKYATVNNPVSPFDTLIIPGLTATQLANARNILSKALRRLNYISDYERELLVPGRLWRCSSTIDYVVSE